MPPTTTVRIAVNGTLMKEQEVNPAFVASGAAFIEEARTGPAYRLWSIQDRHPAMQRTSGSGASIALELWDLPADQLAGLLEREPPGLCVGWVTLENGENVLGVLGEQWLCESSVEITRFGGWRAYIATLSK
jgi:gamma-glutamylcyclotransferase (GGCT)/AIG2-like uncharacterized protein YtfP